MGWAGRPLHVARAHALGASGAPVAQTAARAQAVAHARIAVEEGLGDEDSDRMAKIRKNERERKRRLAVSQGFERLQRLLEMPSASVLPHHRCCHRCCRRRADSPLPL